MVAQPAELLARPVEPMADRRALLIQDLDLYLPLAGLLLIAVACFIGPYVLNVPGPNAGLLGQQLQPPLSPGHILGTDPLGNDIFSRILYGGQVSLEVGFGSQALSILVGGTIGMVAAYKGGIIESLFMRLVDLLLAFPGLVIAIVIATYLGPSEFHVIWAISFFSIPSMARLFRAQTLRLKNLEFISASKLSGQSDRWVLLRHVVPNVIPTILTFACLGTAIAVMVEAGLSFLGLGIPPPQPSWGNMIAIGQTYITSNPLLVLIPAGFLFFTIMCLNLLGDAFRSRISSV